MPSVCDQVPRSERPSRLKGIETLAASAFASLAVTCSERPSRLKGIETDPVFFPRWIFELFPRSERPSRLKGIET